MGIAGLATAMRLREIGWEPVIVERAPERRPGMGYADLPGDPGLILRGDIEAALYDQAAATTEIRYGTSPAAIDEHADGVDVTLRTTDGHENTERFDRVVLVGDAAWCLTLYSGMGASTGIAGADLLGTTLARNPGNTARALREWEQRLRPFIEVQQRSGRTDGRAMFVPRRGAT